MEQSTTSTSKTTSLRPLPTMSSSAWMRLTGICKASAAVRLVRVRINCVKHGAFLSMFFLI